MCFIYPHGVGVHPAGSPDRISSIPAGTTEEYAGLEESILNEGCRDAIVCWGDVIVDGHNRYEICKKHDIPFRVTHKDFADRTEAMLWMIDTQRSRRNLSIPDSILLAQKKTELLKAIAKENQKKAGGDKKSEEYKNASVQLDKSDQNENKHIDVRSEIAKEAGVSTGTVARFEYVQKNKPELVDEMRNHGIVSKENLPLRSSEAGANRFFLIRLPSHQVRREIVLNLLREIFP